MIARELTPDRLASAASRLGAASAAAAAAAASGLHQGHAAAAGAGDSADGDSAHGDSAHGLGHAQTLGMAEAYEHFWGLDFASWPLLHAGGGEVEGGVPMGGVHDIDAAGPDVGQGQGAGWERFSVLSSRSVSAARVCGEVLRDKSPQVPDEGAQADGEAGAGTSPRRQHAYHVRRSQLGCCVVRAVS